MLQLRPTGDNVNMFRTFAALAPAALWTSYFVVLAIAYNVGWPVELAVGVTVIASMTTLILAYVMIPTPVRPLSDSPAPVPPVEVPMPAAPTAGIKT